LQGIIEKAGIAQAALWNLNVVEGKVVALASIYARDRVVNDQTDCNQIRLSIGL